MTSHGLLLEFLHKFLDSHSWTTLFLLCDDTTVVSYYIVTCRNMRAALRPPKYLLNFMSFDSGKTRVDYNFYLSQFSKTARGERWKQPKLSKYSVFALVKDLYWLFCSHDLFGKIRCDARPYGKYMRSAVTNSCSLVWVTSKPCDWYSHMPFRNRFCGCITPVRKVVRSFWKTVFD